MWNLLIFYRGYFNPSYVFTQTRTLDDYCAICTESYSRTQKVTAVNQERNEWEFLDQVEFY